MSEIYDEEKLRSTLKSIYRPVRVSQALKDRVWFSVTEGWSAEAALNPRHFLLRQPIWAVTIAVIALVLISFGIIFPPG